MSLHECLWERLFNFFLQCFSLHPLELSKANTVQEIHFMVVCLSLPSLLRHQESICLCPNYSCISTQMYIQQANMDIIPSLACKSPLFQPHAQNQNRSTSVNAAHRHNNHIGSKCLLVTFSPREV